MRNRPNIFKLAAFFLCALYLLSSLGMTAYACACTKTGSIQLSLIAKQTKSCCAKAQKSSCCAKKQVHQSKQDFQLNKKPCCTTQTVVLKTEHQPEQLRLNDFLVDLSHPVLFADALETLHNISSNDIVEVLCRHVTPPPKIPLIYQHSCLRL